MSITCPTRRRRAFRMFFEHAIFTPAMGVRLRKVPDRSPRSVVHAKATSESQFLRPRAATFLYYMPPDFDFRASLPPFLHPRIPTSPEHIQMFFVRQQVREAARQEQGRSTTRYLFYSSFHHAFYQRIQACRRLVAVPASKQNPGKSSYKFLTKFRSPSAL